MLNKTYTPKRTVCKVTFSLPQEWASSEVKLVGDFNNWDTEADELEKKKGKWVITKRLKPENDYRFKYLIDGEVWKNDDSADTYTPNEFGTEDSVVEVGK